MESSAQKHWSDIFATVIPIFFGGSAAVGLAAFDQRDIAGEIAFFEGLDKVLTVDFFMSIATLAIALVALLIPRMLQESDEIDRIGKEDRPGPSRLNAFRALVRAQKRLLACFLFAMLGLVNAFAFDGVLEYQPPEFSEAGTRSLLMNFAGPWADVAEGATGSGLLIASLTFLMLGARTFLTAIVAISDKEPVLNKFTSR